MREKKFSKGFASFIPFFIKKILHPSNITSHYHCFSLSVDDQSDTGSQETLLRWDAMLIAACADRELKEVQAFTLMQQRGDAA